MWRKIMISVATVAFVSAMAATTAADARMGGFHGGGFRGGGFHSAGIGMRGGFVGGRSFVGGRRFVGGRAFVGGRRFVGRPFIGPRRFGRFHRFNRFAFASVPFFVGGISCWRWAPTVWGWRRVWVC
jgi:hypothetical protein